MSVVVLQPINTSSLNLLCMCPRDIYEGKTQAQSQTRVTQPGRDVIVTRRAQDSKLREPP